MSESIELYNQLKSEFSITSKFYLNKMSGLKTEDMSGLAAETKSSLQRLIDNETSAREKLEAAGISFIELSLVPSQDVETLITTLSSELAGVL